MKVVGHGRDRESAEEDARKKTAAKGRVILAYGDSGYISEDVFEIEVTTVKPGWFRRCLEGLRDSASIIEREAAEAEDKA